MDIQAFEGTPEQIGSTYGRAFAEMTRANVKELVWRIGYEPLPDQDPAFVRWQRDQEAMLGRHWPWLLEEIRAVAAATDLAYEEILLLNLRAWQYNYYGAEPQSQCSSVAVTLADGTVACAGAMDDTEKYYCGAIKLVPDHGHRFISYPIVGTSWGGRGLNDAGLAIGVSSQLLPGLRRLPESINQDLGIRIVLQTCATVDDVRRFCREHPFTMNIVAVDARGGLLCAHATSSGMLELPVQGYAALTNHVATDEFILELQRRGVREFIESATTRPRREKLLAFCRERGGACSGEEVRELIRRYDGEDPATIHNRGTVCLTFANPQVEPQTLWIQDGLNSTGVADRPFEPVRV